MSQEQVIKISYRKIIDLIQSGKLASLERKGLPRKISFWLGRVMDKFEDALRVYQKQHTKLLDEYSDRDDKGQKIVQRDFGDGRKQYKIKPEKQEEFDAILEELLDTEIDVHIYRMSIKLSWLQKSTTPSDMRALDAIAVLEDDLPETDNELGKPAEDE